METEQVTGEKLVATGLCLSRSAEGEIFFVEGLLPTEKAEVEIVKKKAKNKFGEVVKLLSESQYRITPPCEFYIKGCGGCDWQYIHPDAQSEYKRDIVVDALSRIGKVTNAENIVEDTVLCDKENYRSTSRVLATKDKWGFRKRSSNEMLEVATCMVLHPECEMQVQEGQATITDNDEYEISLRREPDPFFGRKLRVSPKSFFQGHVDAPEILCEIVLNNIDNQKKLNCVDLYSGVGIFALALAQNRHKVLSVEGNIHSHKDAVHNLRGLDTYALHMDVNRFDFNKQNFLGECDVVIADPSRDGLKQSGVDAVLSCEADNVILISCDPASGARDINLLAQAGYGLNKVIPVDMFGYNHHVEMVSVLTR